MNNHQDNWGDEGEAFLSIQNSPDSYINDMFNDIFKLDAHGMITIQSKWDVPDRELQPPEIEESYDDPDFPEPEEKLTEEEREANEINDTIHVTLDDKVSELTLTPSKDIMIHLPNVEELPPYWSCTITRQPRMGSDIKKPPVVTFCCATKKILTFGD